MLDEKKKTKKRASALSAEELKQQMADVVKRAHANYQPPTEFALENFMRYYNQSQWPNGDKGFILGHLLEADPSETTMQHLAALHNKEALHECAILLVDFALNSPDLDAHEGDVPRTMATLINLTVSLAVQAKAS